LRLFGDISNHSADALQFMVNANSEHIPGLRNFTDTKRQKETPMKRILTAAAALALMSGIAVAQQQSPEDAQRQGGIATPGGQPTPNAGGQTNFQPADPEEAQRKGTINQPSGAGSNAGKGAKTTSQPDSEEAARKGALNQPSGEGGTAVR
jgi:hypothetical protein